MITRASLFIAPVLVTLWMGLAVIHVLNMVPLMKSLLTFTGLYFVIQWGRKHFFYSADRCQTFQSAVKQIDRVLYERPPLLLEESQDDA